jgi:hypothetical protein
MFGRRLSSFSLPFIASLALVAAAGATTLAVVVSPQTPGTSKAPVAQTLSLTESQIGYANGRASQTLISTGEQLPTSFKDDLGPFTTCAVSDFSDVGNSPPSCPSGSEVGTTSFTAYVPSLNLNVIAAGYIYKTGTNQVDAWVHVTKPVDFSVALSGKLTPGTVTAGPSVAWDLSAAVNLGVTADITSFQTVWNTHTVTVTTRKSTTTKKKKTQTKKKSTTAKSSKRTPAKTTTSTKTVNASTFESTGCPTSGSWNYSATLHYKSGSSETVSSAIDCAPQTTTTVTVTVTSPNTCLLGIICVPKSSSTALAADSVPAKQ